MFKSLPVCAGLNLTMCVGAHLASLVPGAPVAMGTFWPLHLTTMAVFAATIFALIAIQRRVIPRLESGTFRGWFATQKRQREFANRAVAFVPFPLKIGIAVVFLYAMVNFWIFTNEVPGTPVKQAGGYVLMNHGKKLRDISREEYDEYQRKVLRGFSGHWMIFSLVPVGCCAAIRAGLEESFETNDNPES